MTSKNEQLNLADLNLTQLEEACRQHLGWSDECIARSRKLDMRTALARLSVKDPGDAAVEERVEPPSKKSGSKLAADELSRGLSTKLQVTESCEPASLPVAQRADRHLSELKLLAQYTCSGSLHYLPAAPGLYKSLSNTTHSLVRELRRFYSETELALQRLQEAAKIGAHYSGDSCPPPEFESISRDFQEQRHRRITELQNSQFACGELLRKLNASLQLSVQVGL